MFCLNISQFFRHCVYPISIFGTWCMSYGHLNVKQKKILRPQWDSGAKLPRIHHWRILWLLIVQHVELKGSLESIIFCLLTWIVDSLGNCNSKFQWCLSSNWFPFGGKQIINLKTLIIYRTLENCYRKKQLFLGRKLVITRIRRKKRNVGECGMQIKTHGESSMGLLLLSKATVFLSVSI